jgi:heme exporter protein B
MTSCISFAQQVWCLVRKDLRRECRAPWMWSTVLQFGFVLVLTLEMQMDLPAAMKVRVAGGLLWLTVFFAGAFALERAFAVEHEEGCWDALRLYPVSPAVVFFAKTLFNWTTLCVVTAVLVTLFAVFSGAPLLERPGPMLFVALVANMGLAAVGTLVGALTSATRRGGNFVAVLLLPLVLPVVLGAGDATRLILAGDLGSDFWRWVQLLAAFAAMFLTVGALAFEFVMEE